MAEQKTQNCSRVIFPNGFLFLLTLPKFQIPLTLSSHSSGLKIIATKTTTFSESPGRQLSVGIPWIPLKNFCIGVIGQNAKRTLFLSFLWAAHWKNVRGLRWDNFEATGHAHSSFWPKFTKLLRGSVESGNTSKFVGPRPCQSQKIKILFRWNRCF